MEGIFMLMGSFLLTGIASQRLGLVGGSGTGLGVESTEARFLRYEQVFSNNSSLGCLALSSTILRGRACGELSRCGCAPRCIVYDKLHRHDVVKSGSISFSRGGKARREEARCHEGVRFRTGHVGESPLVLAGELATSQRDIS
eukprot:scaffold2300_cov160-Amphora_coffeaeformis.AAC.3